LPLLKVPTLEQIATGIASFVSEDLCSASMNTGLPTWAVGLMHEKREARQLLQRNTDTLKAIKFTFYLHEVKPFIFFRL